MNYSDDNIGRDAGYDGDFFDSEELFDPGFDAGMGLVDEMELDDEADDDVESSEVGSDEESSDDEESPSCYFDDSDDGKLQEPMRIYLQQMGDIPMLSEEEELQKAREIVRARQKFRHAALSVDGVLTDCLALIVELDKGTKRLDRSVDVNVSDHEGKRRVLQLLPRAAATLQKILDSINRDFLSARSKDAAPELRRRLRRRIALHRRCACRVVDELNLRSSELEAILRRRVKRWEETKLILERARELHAFLEGTSVTELSFSSDADVVFREESEHDRARRMEEFRAAKRRLCLERSLEHESLAALERNLARALDALREFTRLRNEFCNSNLRLVVKIAMKFKNSSLTPLDLIQEGNVGLLRAVNKFDPSLQNKFSTYAYYWIRQAILKALPNQKGMIRFTDHQWKQIRQVRDAQARLAAFYQRVPTMAELASEVGLTPVQVNELLMAAKEPVSLDHRRDDDKGSCAEFVPDRRSADQLLTDMDKLELRHILYEILQSYPFMEREIVSLRFGLIDGRIYTLEEIGRIFDTNSERTRQIELRTLRRIRQHPRAAQLKDFMGGIDKHSGIERATNRETSSSETPRARDAEEPGAAADVESEAGAGVPLTVVPNSGCLGAASFSL